MLRPLDKSKFFFVFSSFFFTIHFAFGQSGIWTWISGDSAINAPGVYGTQGTASIYNHPPANYEMVEWKDKQGNFWLYGGTNPPNNDLWKFNLATLEWTWVKGDSSQNAVPVYGTQGIPDPANSPGQESWGGNSWTDTSGALWLFGGTFTNDLWKYDISTNEWTWMKGFNTDTGHHGTIGIPDPANTPGARHECASNWTDSVNNLWLFGGAGYDDGGNNGNLNDLMKYNISTNEWTWMKGSAYVNAAANYGSKGIASPSNDPGGRWTYTKWKDNSGNFWLMGGITSNDQANDVWKYDESANEWTWMNGTNIPGDSGLYENYCMLDTLAVPASRYEHRSSVTDNCGRFWLFGGFDLDVAYNDLWVYDPQLLQWKWLSGASTVNQPGNFGHLGVPSLSNMPPSSAGANAWWGNDNKFYLFGGGLPPLGDVWVFTPDTTCISVCVTPPVANFQSSKTPICANDCIDFADKSVNATYWQWTFAGGNPATSTDENPQSICYPNAGSYDVNLIASNSGGRDTLTFPNYITVLPPPATPGINQVGNAIYCIPNTYTSYQWYYDSVPIPNATDTFYNATQSGNYNVEVTDENGCNAGAGINVTVGIEEFGVSGLWVTVSPNPANDKVTISSRSVLGKIDLSIKDVLGRNVYSSIETPNGVLNKDIDISSFSAGIYFVRISDKNGVGVLKFVKE